MRNPFEFGRELSSEELVDRQQEIAAVKRAILGAGRLFLIGPRRFGKTSLLRAASEQSERKAKAVVLRYDAQAFEALEQKQIIREDQSRGAVRLRLEDPFLAAWVRLVVPE